jgi:hypothetical protein
LSNVFNGEKSRTTLKGITSAEVCSHIQAQLVQNKMGGLSYSSQHAYIEIRYLDWWIYLGSIGSLETNIFLSCTLVIQVK